MTQYGIDVFLHPFVEDLKHFYLDRITVCMGATTKYTMMFC